MFGITGHKARVGVRLVRCESPRLNRGIALDTGGLEDGWGERNSWWSGEMRRYQEEHRWRKRLTGPDLTLRCES